MNKEKEILYEDLINSDKTTPEQIDLYNKCSKIFDNNIPNPLELICKQERATEILKIYDKLTDDYITENNMNETEIKVLKNNIFTEYVKSTIKF